MNTISRRGFLKGMAAGAVSAGAFGLTGIGGAVAQETGAKLFIPGTYTSIQTTDFAKIKVICEVSAQALTNVTYELLETSDGDYFALKAEETAA